MLTAVDAVVCAGLGYFFYQHDKEENFNLSRQTGHKLYLHFLIRGAGFYLPCWVLASVLSDVSVPEYAPFVLALTLSVILTSTVLLWRQFWGPLESTLALRAFKQSGDDLDYICATAIEDESPIQVTLKNGKSYIGYIGRSIEPNKENSYLSIIPMGSGFRDGNGKLRITHWYTKTQVTIQESGAQDSMESTPNLDRFLMAIPRTEIVTCHIFDFDIYLDIQSQLEPESESNTNSIG